MEQQRPVEPDSAREPGSGQGSEPGSVQESEQVTGQRQDRERAPESGGVFPPGLTARVELTVTDIDTAQAVGSGDVPVLGTPRVLALAEAATVAATARRLPPGMTTVGLRVELDHRAPTPVGRTVVAQARLAKVDGRRLLFEVTVTEGTTTVAEGRVERVLVDRQRFVDRALGNS